MNGVNENVVKLWIFRFPPNEELLLNYVIKRCFKGSLQ